MRGRFLGYGSDEPTARWPKDRTVLVASWVDHVRANPRATVLVEHGSGQTYRACERSAENPSYSGSPGYERTVLFVCPNRTVADAWNERYPFTPTAVVGCPALDRWQGKACGSGDGPTVVALAFHWDGSGLIPETGTASRHYERALPGLVDAAGARGWELLGHGHPRAEGLLRPLYRHLGVRWATYEEVMDRASLLVLDNSSIGYEFASLGRPVCWLNSPEYRRDVEHGGRFWSGVEGQVQVDRPDDLVEGVERALADPPEAAESRRRMVARTYAYTDGRAAERAAAAIMEVVGGR